MSKTKRKKIIRDIAGSTPISNFIIWGYKDLDVSVKWLYINILAQDNGLAGETPRPVTLTNVRQHRLADAIQMPYSTFRERLEKLKAEKVKLVGIDHQNQHRLCLMSPDQDEINKAFQVKINLVKSKQDKSFHSLGFTLVPNSLIYGYPDLLPAAKFVYILVRSLDWTGIGAVWHRIRKLADIANIKYRTFKKYLHDLQAVNLLFITSQFGLFKRTKAIHYNQASLKEQKRAYSFKQLSKNLRESFNRILQNEIFELYWSSLNFQGGTI